MMAVMFEVKEKTKDEIATEEMEGRFQQMEKGIWPEEVCKDYVKLGKNKCDFSKMSEEQFVRYIKEGLRYAAVCEWSYRKGEYADEAAFSEDLDLVESETKKLIGKYTEYHPEYKISDEAKGDLTKTRDVLQRYDFDFFKDIPGFVKEQKPVR